MEPFETNGIYERHAPLVHGFQEISKALVSFNEKTIKNTAVDLI